jgi:hypothetical protein
MEDSCQNNHYEVPTSLTYTFKLTRHKDGS